MKIIITVFSTIVLLGCEHRPKPGNLNINLDTFLIDPNISVHWTQPSELLPNLIDSVNHFKKEEKLPDFLYNYNMDYDHPWLTDHFSLSLRKLIFDSTKNIDLLNTIINSMDPRLRRIVDSTEVSDKNLLRALPFREKSNFEMAELRLKELKKSQ